ncbi:uncharacterized protein DDB_G0290685-like [Coffea eugenioides]|uniref:uncharacterized protein DDB_G0290685-like n=1 Tax=Coffea eugenioides TaxID=49369 RepID=UPI000F60D74B|nr:uncharacterized protein DDB_G0290685-like [Coffea eugenioides]
MLNYFLVEHKKPKQTTNVAEYYEEFEEWRNEMLALKPELSEEYFIDGFNFGLHWNIRMKLKGFRNPPKIMYEAYVRAKIEEAVMEKHDSALDLPKGEQLMRENEVMEAEHNDIITNLKDESVVSHMFDELCQRTPMDFLEENQHKTSARDYQEEKAINQVFDRLAHNDCVISQGLSYELLIGELAWQQGSIDKEIFNSASPLHCPRNLSSVSCKDGAVNIVPSQPNRPLDDLIFDPGGSTKIAMNKDAEGEGGNEMQNQEKENDGNKNNGEEEETREDDRGKHDEEQSGEETGENKENGGAEKENETKEENNENANEDTQENGAEQKGNEEKDAKEENGENEETRENKNDLDGGEEQEVKEQVNDESKATEKEEKKQLGNEDQGREKQEDHEVKEPKEGKSEESPDEKVHQANEPTNEAAARENTNGGNAQSEEVQDAQGMKDTEKVNKENVNGEEQSTEKVQDKSEGNSEYVTEANKVHDNESGSNAKEGESNEQNSPSTVATDEGNDSENTQQGSGHDSNPAEGTHEANQEQGNGNETTQQESGESSNPTEGTKEANQQQSISDNSKADADQNQRNAVGDVLPGGDGAQSTQEEQTENKDAATNNDKSDTSSNMKEGSAYGEGSNDVGNRQNAGSDTVGGTEKSSENSSANQVNEKVEIQKSDAHSETGPEEKINPSNDNG